DRVINPDLRFAVSQRFLHERDLILVTSSILNFAPAETDLALYSEQEGLLALGRPRSGNVFGHQILGVVQQHSSRFARFLVLQNFAAKWVRRVPVDSSRLQSGAVGHRSMAINAR